MSLQPAREAASAASTALLVFCIAVAAFLPPISERVLPAGPLVIVALALAIAASFFLHLYFVGIAARRLASPGGDLIEIAVTDQGIGISEKDRERVTFERTAKPMCSDYHSSGVSLNQFDSIANVGGYFDKTGVRWGY